MVLTAVLLNICGSDSSVAEYLIPWNVTLCLWASSFCCLKMSGAARQITASLLGRLKSLFSGEQLITVSIIAATK